MLKILGKLIAAWLTAFAIAGTTVWAGTDDESCDADAPAAEDGRAAIPASTPREDAVDE